MEPICLNLLAFIACLRPHLSPPLSTLYGTVLTLVVLTCMCMDILKKTLIGKLRSRLVALRCPIGALQHYFRYDETSTPQRASEDGGAFRSRVGRVNSHIIDRRRDGAANLMRFACICEKFCSI